MGLWWVPCCWVNNCLEYDLTFLCTLKRKIYVSHRKEKYSFHNGPKIAIKDWLEKKLRIAVSTAWIGVVNHYSWSLLQLTVYPQVCLIQSSFTFWHNKTFFFKTKKFFFFCIYYSVSWLLFCFKTLPCGI